MLDAIKVEVSQVSKIYISKIYSSLDPMPDNTFESTWHYKKGSISDDFLLSRLRSEGS
jgi:hypothetical protein